MCFSSSQTQNQKYEAPDNTRPYIDAAIGPTAALAQTPFPMYYGMRDAGINPWQHGAMQLSVDRALYGDPQLNASRGALMNIAQGGQQNPYLDPGYTNEIIAQNTKDMGDAFARGTAANNDAMAARAGAFGGSGHLEKQRLDAQGLADRVGAMANQTRLGRLDQNASLFNQDRAAQMAAAGMAPTFSMMDIQDIRNMMDAGNQMQGMEQQLLDRAYETFMGEQEWPFKMADFLRNSLMGYSGSYGEGFRSGKSTPSIFSLLFGG